MTKNHRPKGPNDTWKTGQRVPEAGDWADQYGVVSTHELGATFPPCLDRKPSESANRILVRSAAATA